MMGAKEEYLKRLEKGLKRHPNVVEILEEYRQHIDDIRMDLDEPPSNEVAWMAILIERLGSPEEIIPMWMEEAEVTPEKTKWIFFLINSCFFITGSLFTLMYNLLEWDWLNLLWGRLTSIPFVLIFAYLVFWVLLGYEIGKEFGYGGKRLLRKTFFISLIPNITLMYLTLFHIISFKWFEPLLSAPFIGTCVAFTFILYPVSWIGYRWGKRASL